MLVLTRKLNEQIQIGSDITITVVRVKGNSVRVGIEAPRTVRIIRSELPANEETQDAPQRSKNFGSKTAAEQPVESTKEGAHQQSHLVTELSRGEASASSRSNPRRRVPGEKPAVLPRLPRLGPASPFVNRLAAFARIGVIGAQ